MRISKGWDSTEMVGDDPFRVVEMLISLPLFTYGMYLLTPWAELPPSSVFVLADGGELVAQITGVLYSFSGLSLFLASRSGVLAARQMSVLILFAVMLYSAMFRIVEFGITAIGVLFIYITLALAAVDYLSLHGRRKSSSL